MRHISTKTIMVGSGSINGVYYDVLTTTYLGEFFISVTHEGCNYCAYAFLFMQ